MQNNRQNYSSVYLNLYMFGSQTGRKKDSSPYDSKHSTARAHIYTHTHMYIYVLIARTVQNLQQLKHTFPTSIDLTLTRKSSADLNLVQQCVD
jgi:hypothetical protein